MIEKFYALLAQFGFNHPLHPMLTHVPMGMIIGMVVFSFFGLLWQGKNLNRTAYHCSVLALLGVIPVLIAGTLDWLQFMDGEWILFIIIKMGLGTLLTILLMISVISKSRGAEPKKMFFLYLLCLACAGGLGYSGGELVYG